MTALNKNTHLTLVVDNPYPVGNRRSRDLVTLHLVAANDFGDVARKAAPEKTPFPSFRFMADDDSFIYQRLDSMPDPWAPKA